MIAKNINYYLDCYNGIFLFGVDIVSEFNFEWLLNEIVGVTNKTVNLNYDIINNNLEGIKDTLLYCDITLTPYGERLKIDFAKIAALCSVNNNSLIIKQHFPRDISINYGGIVSLGSPITTPSQILHAANMIFSIQNKKLKMAKNRYDNLDVVTHNILAIMRDKKIDNIFN